MLIYSFLFFSFLNLGSSGQSVEEFIINDYPQQARWKLLRKETISSISELTGCGITTRGRYLKPIIIMKIIIIDFVKICGTRKKCTNRRKEIIFEYRRSITRINFKSKTRNHQNFRRIFFFFVSFSFQIRQVFCFVVVHFLLLYVFLLLMIYLFFYK